ncbi:MAG TPA: hypothetical protein PKW35_10395 [Nannocystaceae bacterium]|nr:hypothetical protein [Nannocystaceae bacterium]
MKIALGLILFVVGLAVTLAGMGSAVRDLASIYTNALESPLDDPVVGGDGNARGELAEATLHVRTDTGEVREEGQRPRFLLRVANWLHLNRGKKAWTYAADAYAAGLLALALTGMLMIPGRKGLVGRGALLVAAGVALPVLYVTLSGGP